MSTHYRQHGASGTPETTREAVRRTLLENDEVLAVATTYPPGAGVPLHTHRFPSIVCIIDGGTLQTTTPEGVVETYELRKGETLWSGTASTHTARNVGTTTLRLVEIEVKRARAADESG
jgi:quercetin dioxygenase-like cupin family protein